MLTYFKNMLTIFFQTYLQHPVKIQMFYVHQTFNMFLETYVERMLQFYLFLYAFLLVDKRKILASIVKFKEKKSQIVKFKLSSCKCLVHVKSYQGSMNEL